MKYTGQVQTVTRVTGTVSNGTQITGTVSKGSPSTPGCYYPPVGGVPETDLAPEVQAKLALQKAQGFSSFTEYDTFCREHPGELKDGDLVWIKDQNASGAILYGLYQRSNTGTIPVITIEQGGGGISAEALQAAIEAALTTAKESGEFDGAPGAPGQAGEDGGYYLVTVENFDLLNMKVSFTPSKEGMPEIYPQIIALPQGPKGKDGQDGQNGRDGQNGQDGQDGQDGGYYLVTAENFDSRNMKLTFTPSKSDMVSIPPQVIALPQGPGAELFRVTFTNTSSGYTVDTTNAQIYAAAVAGKAVVGIDPLGRIMQLYRYSSTVAWFTALGYDHDEEAFLTQVYRIENDSITVDFGGTTSGGGRDGTDAVIWYTSGGPYGNIFPFQTLTGPANATPAPGHMIISNYTGLAYFITEINGDAAVFGDYTVQVKPNTSEIVSAVIAALPVYGGETQ